MAAGVRWSRGCAALLTLASVLASACAYTVDCNPDYADCAKELRSIDTVQDEYMPRRVLQPIVSSPTPSPSTPKTQSQTTTQSSMESTSIPVTEVQKSTESTMQPRARLLNLSSDEIQKSIVDNLYNQTLEEFRHAEEEKRKNIPDLSDVSLDGEEEFDFSPHDGNTKVNKHMPDAFFTNLEAPLRGLGSLEGVSSEAMHCSENGMIYKLGEKMERGCEEICECGTQGVFECRPICQAPFIRRGRRLEDPLCFETPVGECCSIVACATENGDTKNLSSIKGPMDICRYGNNTYTTGQKWEIGCEQLCTCEPHSIVTCKPRCTRLPQSDKCINVQDPHDSCCQIQVCDVSSDVHEDSPMEVERDLEDATEASSIDRVDTDINELLQIPHRSTTRPLVLVEPINSVKVLPNNSVQINLASMNTTENMIHIQISSDGGKNYQDVILRNTNILDNLTRGIDYILETKETGTKFNFTIPKNSDADVNKVLPLKNASLGSSDKPGCMQDGEFYSVGEEFHIACEQICECVGPNEKECVKLVCPTHVGLELVSKGCVKWAPAPPPTPPMCCPRAARCLSHGVCDFAGHSIPNWSEVPLSLTGCEQRCFCENGELDCQEVCSPLSLIPPQNFRCQPGFKPAAVNISDEDCCKQWGCVPIGGPKLEFNPQSTKMPPIFLPTIRPEIHFPQEDPDVNGNHIHRPTSRAPVVGDTPYVPSNYGETLDMKKLSVISVQADSPTSIKMMFGLPTVLVGLRGNVDLRYTDSDDNDLSHWQSQIFAPADEILTTARLEFRLSGLRPSTMYKLKGTLRLHDLGATPQSDIYTARTLDFPIVSSEPTHVEEKRREVDSQLVVLDVNDTTAHVTWRHFTEDELQYIDGIQVRYRPVGTPIYSMTELLHNSRSMANLEELRPETRYEASIVLVPPPRAVTEVYDPTTVEFTTRPLVDMYNWSVMVETRAIGSVAVEISWHGVPAPAERFVRVVRAARACGTGSTARQHEHDLFKLVERDQPRSVTLTGLPPDTKCRIWLELFLTNGKVKTSNVLDIVTKPEHSPDVIDNEIEVGSRTSASNLEGRGDYYGALVVVGVVAALGALTSLLLLLVVVRRHRPHSVPITPVPTAPRSSSLPPYDNPAYKLELQQETMNL